MWKIIFLFWLLVFPMHSIAYAITMDFNDLSEGAVVSGAGVFDDFILDSPGDADELLVTAGAFGKQPLDKSVLDKGGDFGGNSIRFTIDFPFYDVSFVAFDVNGRYGDLFGMTTFAYGAGGNFLAADGALIAPPGALEDADIRYVDLWNFTTHEWQTSFALAAEGIKSVQLVYYPLHFDLALDNLTYKNNAPVPEPGILLMLVTGLLGAAGASRKRWFRKK